jgi:hypothetical protein
VHYLAGWKPALFGSLRFEPQAVGSAEINDGSPFADRPGVPPRATKRRTLKRPGSQAGFQPALFGSLGFEPQAVGSAEINDGSLLRRGLLLAALSILSPCKG